MLLTGHFSGGHASLGHSSRMSQIHVKRKASPTYEADLLPVNGAWTACSKPTGPWPPPALLTWPCLTPLLPAAQPALWPDDEMLMAGAAHDLAGPTGNTTTVPCHLEFLEPAGCGSG